MALYFCLNSVVFIHGYTIENESVENQYMAQPVRFDTHHPRFCYYLISFGLNRLNEGVWKLRRMQVLFVVTYQLDVTIFFNELCYHCTMNRIFIPTISTKWEHSAIANHKGNHNQDWQIIKPNGTMHRKVIATFWAHMCHGRLQLNIK